MAYSYQLEVTTESNGTVNNYDYSGENASYETLRSAAISAWNSASFSLSSPSTTTKVMRFFSNGVELNQTMRLTIGKS